MSDELRSFVLRLTSVLTGWVVPLLVALFGAGLYAVSGKYSGEQKTALQITAWVMWINAPIYNLRGYAVTVLQANEIAAAHWWEAQKPKLEKPLTELKASTTEGLSVQWYYLKMHVDPAKLKTIAANPEPFSEPEMVTVRKVLSAGEFRTLKKEMLERGLLERKGPDVRQGYKLSGLGVIVMRQIASGECKPVAVKVPPPLPQLG